MTTIEKIKIEDLTFEQCEQYHREMWTWLAETGEVAKHAWPGWAKFDKIPDGMCFACVVAAKLNTPKDPKCSHCPLEWNGGLIQVRCLLSTTPYHKWTDGRVVPHKRKQLAQQIADLPWRKI